MQRLGLLGEHPEHNGESRHFDLAHQPPMPLGYSSQPIPRGDDMAIKPVRFGESGAKVTALHKDLLYLIHYQGSVTDGMRAANEAYLAHDLIPNRFGSATAGIVGIYQAQLVSRVKAKTKNNPDPVPDKFGGIPMLRSDTGNGAVDVLTAEALNWL